MNQKTEGIILSRKNFQEADKLLTIYTKDFGKISCIARGVRRPTSRKSGHLEIGSWCKLYIAKGKNLDILTEVELQKPFGLENLLEAKANRVYHILELVDYLTVHGQKNYQVFTLLLTFLKKVADEKDFNLISTTFKLKLLSTLGFFSAVSLKSSGTRSLLEKLETEDFEKLKEEILFTEENYLKLLAFLDSIIENVTERKLKTSRFVNARI